MNDISIIEAMDDPALFAPYFDRDDWAAWRAFLAALFALPMTDAELAIYQRHTGRALPPAQAIAEAALIVGRRGGKSRVLALIAVFLACFRDYAPHLAPGEVATIGVLAANRPQARSIFRYVTGLLKAVPMLAPMIADDSNESIELTNRVVIEIATASFRTARGYSFAAVLADEVAFWRLDDTAANPDREILRALRPGMATIPGSILLLASSPYAKKGELYASYRRHYGKDAARVLVWKAPTDAMNPRIDPAIIAEAYEDDPASAASEYGAEFRDDLADFITREAVDAITCTGRKELPPEPGITYSAFCDPSGGVSDAMTLAIAHLRGDVAILNVALEIRPPFDPDVAVADCAALLRQYGITRITGDRYAGQWPVARFAAHGITFEQSARPKSDLYLDFLPIANAKRAELLDIPRLAAQLTGLERRTARSGKDSVDHAPGGHDDIANAVCGVLVELDLDRRPALVKPDDLHSPAAPLGLPIICDYVFAVLAVGDDGHAATVYAARSKHLGPPLTILDFDAAPLTGATFAQIAHRLAELAPACRARLGSAGLMLPAALATRAAAAGLLAHPLPPELDDADGLSLTVASHISGGGVKITGDVAEKAKSSPFGGALSFRLGDKSTDPLRLAALQTVTIALEAA